MNNRLLSPYERVLASRIAGLHPTLQRYFSTIPDGYVGIGEGEFARAGTPKRWLWPAIWWLQRRHVIFVGWERNVAFRIRNRTVHGKALGERTFVLRRGEWVMNDAVHATPHNTVVDVLGSPSTLAAEFTWDVIDGALHMVSTRVGLRLGRLNIRVPRPLAPTVRLSEQYDDELDRQRVSVTIDAPLIGRIYEYGGTFTYRIQKETA